MRFFNSSPTVYLVLTKNLTRSLKRGHPWIYSQAVKERPDAPAGSYAVLKDRKGRKLASGYYDPDSPIVFRVCSLTNFSPNNSRHIEDALNRCRDHRKGCVGLDTTGYRFINGEGDGLPGVICDIYDNTAVLCFDGAGADAFWNKQALSEWLLHHLRVENIVVKPRHSDSTHKGGRGQPGLIVLAGGIGDDVTFLENGVKFSVNISRGQKTGFFLDQRNNRQMIRQFSQDRSVLNLFGYTGGFSVYAGLGRATRVTTVDLSKPAVEASEVNWRLNDLDPADHQGLASDAFEFLENSRAAGLLWDLVIVDPPSFASSKESVPKATKAYEKLIAGACGLVATGGLLAASSCSSHIDHELFLAICEDAISRAHKRGRVIHVGGQPPDHPFPLASREFRYLKFVLLEVY